MRDFDLWIDPQIKRRLTSWRAQSNQIQMYYTYILHSEKDNKLYIGYTSNLKKRFLQHQKGEVFATKSRLPVKLVFYEAFLNQKDALRREKYFKSNPGKHSLKLILREYLAQSLV